MLRTYRHNPAITVRQLCSKKLSGVAQFWSSYCRHVFHYASIHLYAHLGWKATLSAQKFESSICVHIRAQGLHSSAMPCSKKKAYLELVYMYPGCLGPAT